MSLARAASAFIERRPNATTVAAAMARGAAGDACAQHAEDAPCDARRCATFMAWSTGVAFALDRYVYSHLFALWWPPVWKSNLRHVRLLDSVAVRFLTARRSQRGHAVAELPTHTQVAAELLPERAEGDRSR